MNEQPALLVVDDREENLVAFAALLEGEDRRVLRARSGREALELLLVHDVALALVDVQMPEMDGFELAELMRGTSRTRGIPIIFVTAGHHDQQRVFDGYGSGAVDFLAKPVEPRILAGKVAVFVELWRQRRQLAARVAELEAVLAAVPAAVFMIRDAEQGEIVGNHYAHEVLRLPRDSGAIPQDVRPYRILVGGQELDPERRPLQSVAADGTERRGYAMDVEFANGERVNLYGNATPLRTADGRVRGAVGAFVDVTRLREAEARLREADRSKDEFLAALSHELRNPLMPITTSVHLLKRAPAGSEPARRALEVIDRQAHHLARLVDDLLDLTRIGNGKVQLRIQPVELVGVLKSAVEDHRAAFATAGVELAVDLPAGPVWIEADPARVAQVVGNLLGNAAKFTPAGGQARLELAVAGGEARLVVRDDGVGIAPEMLPRLFRPFAQADRTLDRSRGGLGLGLAVVKSLVEMQRGSVEVHSDGVGRGAEFRVRLPLRDAAPAASASPGIAATRCAPRRVLLVEDNVDGADMLAEAIRLLGHEVTVVHEGTRALEAARRIRPHVVFCDIGLPGMDGYAVAEALSRDDTCRGSKLVAVSGYAMPADRERALACGFAEHVSKPPPLETVRELIERAG